MPEPATTQRVRKLLHIGFGAAAFLLPVLSREIAVALAASALAFNAFAFPRLGGRALYRDDEVRLGFSPGMLAYPLAVLGLVLTFPPAVAGAIWILIAFGDGLAGLVGANVRSRPIPWNPAKSWAGTAAFVVGGGTMALLFEVMLQGEFAGQRAACIAVTAVTCALIESLPIRFPDNLTIALVGGPLLHGLFAIASCSRAVMEPWLGLIGLVTNVLLVLPAWRLGTLDRSGAVAAALVGATVFGGAGWQGLSVLIAFFLMGNVATRLGAGTKESLGLAEPEAGARSARQVLANGGVPAFMALAGVADLTGPAGLAYRAGFAAAVAAAACDTVSSEIGQWLGSRTWRITSLAPCPAGENGGVSIPGTLAGIAAAAAIALLARANGIVGDFGMLAVFAGGLAGGLTDSVLGDLLERRSWLDNEAVNFACTYAGALTAYALLAWL